MPYSPILATLGYVFHPEEPKILMIHRNRRPGDSHLGKYNGLGGKLEAREHIFAGMRRELHEEANIDATGLQLAGTISWPGFGKDGEDWFGFLFRILAFTGNIPKENAEGTLHWIPIPEVMQLPMWEGDRYFLPMILDRSHPTFHAVMPYENGKPVGWDVSIG